MLVIEYTPNEKAKRVEYQSPSKNFEPGLKCPARHTVVGCCGHQVAAKWFVVEITSEELRGKRHI